MQSKRKLVFFTEDDFSIVLARKKNKINKTCKLPVFLLQFGDYVKGLSFFFSSAMQKWLLCAVLCECIDFFFVANSQE